MGTSAIVRPAIEALEPYMKSMESILKESSVGTKLSEFLKSEFEPAIGKEAMNLVGKAKAGGGVHDAASAYYAAREAVADISFGSKRQALIPLLKTAERQGGPAHAAEVADAMSVYLRDPNPYWRIAARKSGLKSIATSSPYKVIGEGEKAVKSIAAPMFLPRISIPHASQAPLNSLIINGWKASAQALAEFSTSPQAAYKLSLDAGAQSQELMHEFINQTRGASKFRMLIDPLRKVFSFERKWGIAFSAVSGKWAAINAAEDFAASGGADKRAMLHLKVLGLDPQAILQQGGRLTVDDIEQAAFRAASEIMGMRSPLETPYGWEKNAAMRIATLYKHYGFRQTKLIKNALIRAKEAEGWTGVAKIAGTLGTTFFVAGEAIKAVEDMISLRQPWSDDEEKNNFLGSEYIDGIAHAGGFGIIYSTLRSAKHNNLTGYLAGPVIDSTLGIVQDAWNLRGKSLARDIGRKFGLPGTAAVNLMFPPQKKKQNTPYY